MQYQPPYIKLQNEVTTGPDGRYVFEKVFPGDARIGLYVDRPTGTIMPSTMTPMNCPAGKTTHFDLDK